MRAALYSPHRLVVVAADLAGRGLGVDAARQPPFAYLLRLILIAQGQQLDDGGIRSLGMKDLEDGADAAEEILQVERGENRQDGVLVAEVHGERRQRIQRVLLEIDVLAQY